MRKLSLTFGNFSTNSVSLKLKPQYWTWFPVVQQLYHSLRSITIWICNYLCVSHQNSTKHNIECEPPRSILNHIVQMSLNYTIYNFIDKLSGCLALLNLILFILLQNVRLYIIHYSGHNLNLFIFLAWNSTKSKMFIANSISLPDWNWIFDFVLVFLQNEMQYYSRRNFWVSEKTFSVCIWYLRIHYITIT